MASIQHVTTAGRDCWRVRFYVDKKRQTIGLGAISEDKANEAAENIDVLIECARHGRLPGKTTRKWLEDIPSDLHDRLAAIELVEARTVRDLPRTVIAYCRNYMSGRKDWKKPENYRQAVDKLEDYLGKDIPLTALTQGEADRWHRWMIKDLKLSPNTAGQSVKRCRQIMKAAIDDGLLEHNPLKGVKIDLSSDKTKNQYITLETSKAILEACPDQEWRVVFALARFGGLRCPSEVLRLRWSDIDWDRGRFKVTSPKTERYGKGERIVPLFPELKTELESLRTKVYSGLDVAADSFVIQRYRGNEQNLRTELLRIADRAGVAKWPKPFMALRATRRTELERSGKFANHVLNDWFGHSGAIAETHYLQTTEEDYELAGGSPVVPFVVPSVGCQYSPTSFTKSKNPGETGVVMVADGSGRTYEYT